MSAVKLAVHSTHFLRSHPSVFSGAGAGGNCIEIVIENVIPMDNYLP